MILPGGGPRLQTLGGLTTKLFSTLRTCMLDAILISNLFALTVLNAFKFKCVVDYVDFKIDFFGQSSEQTNKY
jgi:hypothetical protein